MTHYIGIFSGTLYELYEWMAKMQYELKLNPRIMLPLDIQLPKDKDINSIPLPGGHNQVANYFDKLPLKRQIFKLLTRKGWGYIEPYIDHHRALNLHSPKFTILLKKDTWHGDKTVR